MCGELKPERGFGARMALWLIRGYQRALSPWLGANCRYLPTCSAYAAEAIGRFGLLRGVWLGLRRIGRCHPLATAGVDPVPRNFVWWGRESSS